MNSAHTVGGGGGGNSTEITLSRTISEINTFLDFTNLLPKFHVTTCSAF